MQLFNLAQAGKSKCEAKSRSKKGQRLGDKQTMFTSQCLFNNIQEEF